jgi:hypothetical protein
MEPGEGRMLTFQTFWCAHCKERPPVPSEVRITETVRGV